MNEVIDYAVWPGVVKTGTETEIYIQPKGGHARFDCAFRNWGWTEKWNHLYARDYAALDKNTAYKIYILPMEESIEPLGWQNYPSVVPEITEDGGLKFSYTFAREQEYILAVEENNSKSQKLRLRIYAVDEDLYGLRAYKGDMHVHSHYSDGREAPEFVAANYRKAGFDFMAQTDHHKYFPSLKLMEAFKNIPVGIKFYPGEEVHEPGGYIHVINFGGSFSVNEYYLENKEACDRAIDEIKAGLTEISDEAERLDIARRLWIARQIKSGGGLAVLVHPHWINMAYNMRDTVTDYLFEHQVYDAFELLGGQSVRENNMQIAFYEDQLMKGRTIPVLGLSDSHGTEPPVCFLQSSTIVLSEDDSFEALVKNIKDYKCVAVDDYPKEDYRVYGRYRIVKYCRYLLDTYFPVHDSICAQQGQLMKDYICGDENVVPILEMIKDRVENYAHKFFGN